MIFRATDRGILVALTAVLIVAPAVRGDTFRVKTDRGMFLVEVNDPALTVRGDGEELALSRTGGDEIRLRLDSDRADRATKEPVLMIRRDGRVIASARRIGAGPLPATAVAATGVKVLNGRTGQAAWSLAVAADGRTLLAGTQGSLRTWDLPTFTERLNQPTNTTVRRVAGTPDGATIATAEHKPVGGKTMGNVVIRDGKTGAVRRVMSPVEALHCVTIAPDGKVVVSSTWAETDLRVWDVETGEQVGTLRGHSGAVGTVVYSPDGKTLASGGDTTVRLWDVDTGKVRSILRGHENSVESLAFSADGQTLASGGFDDTARVWDVASGKLVATMEYDHPVLAVALTADGKAVAAAGARWGNGFYNSAPAQVKVWDVATGKPRATLPDQPGQVFALCFTPDGKSLVTGSLAGTITVYDLASFPAPAEPAKP